ncbi:MAG: hypothetical protein RMY36_005290 [Nostoc sp. SerVER01]|nr:hypothetical protein [Nostoc sp. DedQUE11]MDZ8078507.1 hypothetical protein [Nostoc sp. DcaGUA01]
MAFSAPGTVAYGKPLRVYVKKLDDERTAIAQRLVREGRQGREEIRSEKNWCSLIKK